MTSQGYLERRGESVFLSTDHVIYICPSPFAADSLLKKYNFARSVDQNQTKQKNPQTLKTMNSSSTCNIQVPQDGQGYRLYRVRGFFYIW